MRSYFMEKIRRRAKGLKTTIYVILGVLAFLLYILLCDILGCLWA